jgi:hypothetical protein
MCGIVGRKCEGYASQPDTLIAARRLIANAMSHKFKNTAHD